MPERCLWVRPLATLPLFQTACFSTFHLTRSAFHLTNPIGRSMSLLSQCSFSIARWTRRGLIASFVLGLATPGAASPKHDGHHSHGLEAGDPKPIGDSVPEKRNESLGRDTHEDTGVGQDSNRPRTTGQGDYVFRHRPVALPPEMKKHLVHAHGGFAVHTKELGGDGSAYFSLKGVGLLRLSADLSRVETVGGDSALSSANIHNTCLFQTEGKAYLALPSDQAQTVWLTDLQGGLVQTFLNPYVESGRPFRVCDVEYVDGRLFATNGYADNVCFTARPSVGSSHRSETGEPTFGTWDAFRFGGSGKQHGKFGTAHGITRVPGTSIFTVADRAHSRLESYTVKGRYVGGIHLPEGCLPCDVDYFGPYALVGCLKGPGGSTPAPIYLLRDGNIVSEINIGKDLGLPGFTHIHNAAFRIVEGDDGRPRMFILAYAWNPGEFAVLEPVPVQRDR